MRRFSDCRIDNSSVFGNAMVNVRQAIDCVRADIWTGDKRVNFHTAIKAGRVLANHIDEIDESVFEAEQKQVSFEGYGTTGRGKEVTST